MTHHHHRNYSIIPHKLGDTVAWVIAELDDESPVFATVRDAEYWLDDYLSQQ